MADRDHLTSNPPAQTANLERVLPDDTSAGGGEDEDENDCSLWDGHIIDATFPLL